jgi:hypothetical protein
VPILQTSYRSKLPKGWSYPVGAELLSRALAGIDGAADRALYFNDYHIRDSRHRRLREQDEPYPIVSVGYRSPWSDAERQSCAARGLVEVWAITIDPVPSDQRAQVRRCVEASGLHLIREWLERARGSKTNLGRGSCRILYHQGRERLLFEQRLNNFHDPTLVELACNEGV